MNIEDLFSEQAENEEESKERVITNVEITKSKKFDWTTKTYK